jgi:hypothetical protein
MNGGHIPQSLREWLDSLPVVVVIVEPIPPNWENTPEAKLAEVNVAELNPHSVN